MHIPLWLWFRFSGLASVFWGDFKRAVDNPWGLLWLLIGFSILALAAWANIAPATVPTAMLTPLLVVFVGFLAYFAWRGVRVLGVRMKAIKR